MIFKSTKIFRNLPCSHQQWQDSDESCEYGTGHCAQTHGYSREFHFEFSCDEVDEYGWVVGFSSLKEMKNWLEFMFDHTSLWEAGDPRLQQVQDFNSQLPFPAYNMRVLPSGVSMEQTALFVATHVCPHIANVTGGRCWVSRIEVRENDKNSGILELSKSDSDNICQYSDKIQQVPLSKQKEYSYIPPHVLIKMISNSSN